MGSERILHRHRFGGALILAMAFGFKVVLFVAGLCYLGSLMVMTMHSGGELRRRGKPRESRILGEDEERRSLSLRSDEAVVSGR